MSTHAEHEELLRNALSDLAGDPSREAAWDAAEASARSLQRPDEVIARYRDALARTDVPGLAASLGERALAFVEEWSGDTDARASILSAVLAAEPASAWAFERLTMVYTVDERWNDLLALYDRTLASTPADDAARRRALLEEAANIAREFAAQPDRAATDLESLFALDPADGQTARALERLYERQGRHRELIHLLTARLPHLGADAQIAALRHAQRQMHDAARDDDVFGSR